MEDDTILKLTAVILTLVGAIVYTNKQLLNLLSNLGSKIDALGAKIDRLTEKIN